eukprot:NODE_1182_length_1249_cov_4.315000_g961_i0.p1 GENE.NODE_1182_length_1249_cov_4.315000_g961_i0~~NODE_1182_length_1249_cov_4.315000_g961_i0.p1  ORF type:complete len:94 (-),score=10.30 NODE_1182_length_1249_cov_4.315000_g961_i0:131-412(-)
MGDTALNGEKVVHTYVIEDIKDSQRLTDMVSFYVLPQVYRVNHPKDVDPLRIAHLFYTVPNQADVLTLATYALCQAKEMGIDMLSTVDTMENI